MRFTIYDYIVLFLSFIHFYLFIYLFFVICFEISVDMEEMQH